MVAINMRIFKMVLIFVCIWTNVEGHPTDVSVDSFKSPPASTLEELSGDHYDQRQNGTENYRIHVDGLVLVVAPAEALLLAGGLADGTESNLLALGQNGLLETSGLGTANFSKPKPEVEDTKSANTKSTYRSRLRLMNLIAPILQRIRH